LGYTNVALYQVGYPDWVKVTGLAEMTVNPATKTAAVAEKPKAQAGKSYAFIKTAKPGQITADSFKALLKENAGKALIVDVRDLSEIARDGTFKGALKIPVGELGDKLAGLPKDRPVVFFCSTGGRAGEAYDTVTMLGDGINAFFLDAEVRFKKGGAYTIKPNG
ncbi:rhodanese-like domain-containing protein, partial [Pseudomonadota bacterium]